MKYQTQISSQRLLRRETTEPSCSIASTGQRLSPHVTPATAFRAALTVGQVKKITAISWVCTPKGVQTRPVADRSH